MLNWLPGSNQTLWLRLLIVTFSCLYLSGCVSDGLVPVELPGQRDRNTYIVQKGDTLYAIAFQFGMDYKELARLNKIGPPYTIFVDQKITLHKKAKITPRSDSGPKVVKKSPAPGITRTPARSSASAGIQVPSNLPDEPRWGWPHKGRILQVFSRGDPVSKGLDIGGDPGDRINAAADGVVVYAGGGLRGYGKLVIVKHNDRYLSAYGHNRDISVKEGQKVKKGQKLAELGSNGSESLLHFEIRLNGKPEDPMKFLPK